MAAWRRGGVAAWRRGDMATWRRGDVTTWRHGDVAGWFVPTDRRAVVFCSSMRSRTSRGRRGLPVHGTRPKARCLVRGTPAVCQWRRFVHMATGDSAWVRALLAICVTNAAAWGSFASCTPPSIHTQRVARSHSPTRLPLGVPGCSCRLRWLAVWVRRMQRALLARFPFKFCSRMLICTVQRRRQAFGCVDMRRLWRGAGRGWL